MIKFSEIRTGDYLLADNDGDIKRGEVVNLNGDEKQVCVDTGVQEFWYETNQLAPLPLSDSELLNFKFHREMNEDRTVKYSKGAFRLLTPAENDFSRLELWYRDEKRHINTALSVHQLQNHFFEMTKVHLNDESFG